MSEPRKNHLTIDGGQVKEDDHVASYKPIPESDTADFRTSKSSLGKSKEKVSPDGAEEKLLSKEDEAKIVRVDMADAKYVVGDHRNGDAKIELDANKKQFSGLTKEELMKYADDPFWVNLRWCMFVLFWTLWLAMLAGAITIIVRAPKCAPPTPLEWFDKYPLVETEGEPKDVQSQLESLKSSQVGGVFVKVPTYDAPATAIEEFKHFVEEAKKIGVNVIVDLIPNFVSTSHSWFVQSANKTEPYTDYFIWTDVKKYTADGAPENPNNWVSVHDTPAWTLNEQRKQFYLHQYEGADLNFRNPAVVAEFEKVLRTWLDAGARGVRLVHARELLVNASFPREDMVTGAAGAGVADHTTYGFWQHQHSSDQPELDALVNKFAAIVKTSDDKVFTIKEDGPVKRVELFRSETRNFSSLRPPSAAPLTVSSNATLAAERLNKLVEKQWPLLQLKSDSGAEADRELALFAMLLPATPVLGLPQIRSEDNDTALSSLVDLRSDASVEHGRRAVLAVPAALDDPADNNSTKLLACARWKTGHTGYIAVYNPTGSLARADLTGVATVPAQLSVHEVSIPVHQATNYTKNAKADADSVIVPSKSTVVLSYVPLTVTES